MAETLFDKVVHPYVLCIGYYLMTEKMCGTKNRLKSLIYGYWNTLTTKEQFEVFRQNSRFHYVWLTNHQTTYDDMSDFE